MTVICVPAVRFWIETPGGDFRDPDVAGALSATFAVGTDMQFYRFALPLPLGPDGARDGTWHVVLELDEDRFKERLSQLKDDEEGKAAAWVHGVLYSVSGHAYSNLRLNARLDQNSLEPGAEFFLSAVLSEYYQSVEGRARVVAKVERPDRTTALMALGETVPGIFQAAMPTTMSGLYRLRILAEGKTRRGRDFTREQSLSGAVFQGGDGPFAFGGNDPGGRDEDLCALIECLWESGAIRGFLERNHIEPDALRSCLESYGRKREGRVYEHARVSSSTRSGCRRNRRADSHHIWHFVVRVLGSRGERNPT